MLSKDIRRKKLYRLSAALLFFVLLWQIFSHVTYLFRNADFGSRAFILDFHSEKENSLDVVYIGGSNVYCYYDPMVVWKKYGITSYCYSVPQMDAGVMLSAIKDVLKSQSPQLIICDVRKFLSSFWYDEITMGVRNVLDSYDVDFDRLEAVDYYRRINGFSFHEMLPEYLDSIYYHTNYSALASSEHWNLTNNSLGGGTERPDDIFKGYRPASPDGVTAYFRDYKIASSEARTPLLEQAEHCFRDILEYCQKHEIGLLLVESPYIIQHEKDVSETNTMADIAMEYSVPFWNYNTQEMYDVIDLDFGTDIFDCNHVNCLGARKYTEQFVTYLHEHYSLKDHRKDGGFSKWEEMYQEKYLPYMQVYTDKIEKEADSLKATLDKEAIIRSSEDVTAWLSLIKDPNITILFSLDAQSEKEKMAYCLCFDRFKEFSKSTTECVGTITNGEISFSEGSKAFSGTIDMPTGVPQIKYTISRDGADSMICVNEKGYKNEEKEGVHAVVLNENTGTIIDAVRILKHGDDVELIHLPL